MSDTFETYQVVIAQLEKMVQPLFQEYAPYLACQKGCSSCCINSFKIRYIEGRDLIQALQQYPVSFRKTVQKNLNPPEQTDRCPLLTPEGSCSIYANRPLLCRAYGVILETEQNDYSCCPLNFQELGVEANALATEETRSLKVLSLMPYYDILDSLSEQLAEAEQQTEPHSDTITGFLQKYHTEWAPPA